MSENKKLDHDTKANLEIDRRAEVIDDWLDAAADVIDRSQSKEAIELAEFFDGRIALGVPGEEKGYINYFYLGDPGETDPEHFVYLTPFLSGDASRMHPDDPRQEFIEGDSHQAARFTEGAQAIYLPAKGEQGSSTMRGLLLIHEMMHARNKILGNFRSEGVQDDPQYFLEEAVTYDFELDLLNQLAGKAYSRHVEHYVRRFVKQFNETSEIDFALYFEPATYRKIQKKLGLNDSDFDKGLFLTIAMLDVVRKTFRITFPDTWLSQLAQYISEDPFYQDADLSSI